MSLPRVDRCNICTKINKRQNLHPPFVNHSDKVRIVYGVAVTDGVEVTTGSVLGGATEW